MENFDIKNKSENKSVGIVIPIYNTEKYIQECLESVLNQNYSNISVVLINDGSTDNSMDIAKKYVEKHKHFVLIDKENFGQSSARNVGIQWFSGKYDFHIESTHNNDTPQSLYQYNVITNASCSNHIYKIYHSTNMLQIPSIDYIMFLDSDDYYHPDCILEILECANGVDIVWFGCDVFYDGVDRIWDKPQEVKKDEKPKKDKKTKNKKKDENEQAPINCFAAFLKGCNEGKISREQIWEGFATFNFRFFVFAVNGMIDFNFLKKISLLFFEKITAEDQLFGTLLFLQANNVYLLNKLPYVYRVRPNSTCGYAGGALIPTYLKSVYGVYGNALRWFQVIVSELVICSEIAKFLEKNQNNYSLVIAKKLVPFYANQYIKLLNVDKLPTDTIERLNIVEPYLKGHVSFIQRLRIRHHIVNKIYNLLRKLYYSTKKMILYLNIYNILKKIERKIRRAIKRKNR